ncbi:transmembrane protein, putative [Medicago truncatula]|uniref:Transmembrane protein, putative n=1 Tax=Medicago truncatula TaxID=3880 RepID=A0A072V2Y7_MEDTR|nr:transmembrane protein, putative [Medicago truncatula]
MSKKKTRAVVALEQAVILEDLCFPVCLGTFWCGAGFVSAVFSAGEFGDGPCACLLSRFHQVLVAACAGLLEPLLGGQYGVFVGVLLLCLVCWSSLVFWLGGFVSLHGNPWCFS